MAKAKDSGPEVVGLRFRRATTVEGTLYQANQAAFVPNCDEAWDAVNTGAADLEPPAGSPGQVKPEDIPERLTQAPAPQVPVLVPFAGNPLGPTGGPVTAAPVGGTDYEAMTSEDLHKLASDRNIEGRSELKTKADLVKAHQKFDRAQTKNK